MAYERINWQNEPSEATALNDVNLNKMDSAIYELDGKATTTETAITNLQDGKVDKVNGKGLSQVDNVSVTSQTNVGDSVAIVMINRVNGTESVAIKNGIVVDNALSSSSTNPVQNKVVKSALDGKVDKVTGKGLSTNDFSNAYKTKLDTIPADANHVEIEQVVTEGTTLANITIDGTTTAIKGRDIAVDEELSPTSENPVENKAIYDALNNLLPSKTVSGNPISISDASGLNAKALTVSMNPIQDLHGYDYPWVGGAGKNKVDFPQYAKQSSEGFTISVEDNGYIHYVGTATSGYAILTNNIPISLSSGTVITFSRTKSVNHQHYLDLTYTDETHDYLRIYLGATSGTFTLQKALKSVQLVCLQLTIGTSYDETIGFQLEIGSTATDYATYENICPISGRTEASVTRMGKNFFDTSLFQRKAISGGTGEPFDSTTRIMSNDVIVEAGSYTYQNSNNYKTALYVYNADGSYPAPENEENWSTTNPRTVTFGGKRIVRLIFAKSDDATITLDEIGEVQIEKGSTATTYEPYTAETHTKEFGQTVYGGWLDLNSGLLSVTHNVITPTINFIYDSYNNISYANFPKGTDNIARGNFNFHNEKSNMCVCLGSPSDDWDNANNIGKIFSSATNTAYWIGVPKGTTLAEAQALYNGLQLYYELATPIIIQLSSEALTLLKGLNVISTDGDDMELKYSVSLDSLLPTTTRTLAKSPIVEEPKVETDETEEQR